MYREEIRVAYSSLGIGSGVGGPVQPLALGKLRLFWAGVFI